MHVAGGADRFPVLLAQLDDFFVQPDEVVVGPDFGILDLALQKDVVAQRLDLEIIVKFLRLGKTLVEFIRGDLLGVFLQHEVEKLARHTGAAYYKPFPILLKHVSGNKRMTVEIFRVGNRNEIVNVVQSFPVLGVKNDVVGVGLDVGGVLLAEPSGILALEALLQFLGRNVAKISLNAEEKPDAQFLGLLVGVGIDVHVAVIGDAHRGMPPELRPGDKIVHFRKRVHGAHLRVRVQLHSVLGACFRRRRVVRPQDGLGPQEKFAASLVEVQRPQNFQPLPFLYVADGYLFLAAPLGHLEDLDGNRVLTVGKEGGVGPTLALLVGVGENFPLNEDLLSAALPAVKVAHRRHRELGRNNAVAVNDLFGLRFLLGQFRGALRLFLFLLLVVLAAEVARHDLDFAGKAQADAQQFRQLRVHIRPHSLFGRQLAVHFQKNVAAVFQDVVLLYKCRLVPAHGEGVI